MDQEKLQLMKVDEQAEKYFKKYKPQMEALEGSVLSKVRNGIDPWDYWALGKQLEQFEIYQAVCEEAGNTNLLGKLPNIAFDVNGYCVAA